MLKHSAVVAVFDATGEVLVLRRSRTDPWKPYHWNFPGGGVDRGETIQKGAHREVLEEAGINLPPKSLSYLFSFQPKQGHEVHVFAALLPNRPEVGPGDGEHDKYTWARLDRLPGPGIPYFPEVSRSVALRLLDTMA